MLETACTCHKILKVHGDNSHHICHALQPFLENDSQDGAPRLLTELSSKVRLERWTCPAMFQSSERQRQTRVMGERRSQSPVQRKA